MFISMLNSGLINPALWDDVSFVLHLCFATTSPHCHVFLNLDFHYKMNAPEVRNTFWD